MSDAVKVIDPVNPPKVEYCVPLWVRDEQIKMAIARPIPRIQPDQTLKDEPIACVGFGPSLNDTWEELKQYKTIMSCSGATRFLLDHGIVPTYHVEVDPRPHKVQLLGEPHPDIQYLIASACHPDVFNHLKNNKVTLWHVFDSTDEAIRTLPHGEWALTGGCSVGVRMLTLARFFGYREQHIYGMDGCEGASGKHAAPHPMQPVGHALVTYEGREFKTTSGMYAVAQGIWHELDEMPDVNATFHGDGLIQHMAKFYKRTDVPKKNFLIGFVKPEVISSTYRDLNKQLHATNIAYGVGGGKHAKMVLDIAKKLNTTSILDYGCGKGYLAKEIPYPIWEYDPAIPGKDESPRPADLVVCTDVLEHIEPEYLLGVLADLKRVTKTVGYFTIHTGAARKTLPDGRNTHLIQKHKQWWKNRLKAYFKVDMVKEVGPELHVIVSPKQKAQTVAA